MKKTVPFELFGNKGDYLTLNLKDLVAIEAVTGKPITQVWSELVHSNYSLQMIYEILPIAYAACDPALEAEEFGDLIEKAVENGASIQSFALPLATAILETGIFGKAPKKQKNAEATPKTRIGSSAQAQRSGSTK